MQKHGNVLVFERTLDDQRLFCAFNLSQDPARLTLPVKQEDEHWVLFNKDINAVESDDGEGVALPGWGYTLLQLER